MTERKIAEKKLKESLSSEYASLIKKKDKTVHYEETLPGEGLLTQLQSFKCSKKLCIRLSMLHFVIISAYLLIYFLCFYAVLFGFMTGLLIIILQLIISEDRPFLTGHQTPLDLAPGMLSTTLVLTCIVIKHDMFFLSAFKKVFMC